MKKLILSLAFIFAFSSCGTENAVTQIDYRITDQSSFEDFQGHPSAIVFGGTFCPHCVKAIPEFKTQIWDNYRNTVNVWVQVIDKKRFDVELAQGFNDNLDYNTITGENCEYVPSWLVLDANKKLVTSSCGATEGLDVMEETLKGLL